MKFCMVVAGTLAMAVRPAGAQVPIVFEDGLSFDLPSGWVASSDPLPSKAGPMPAGFEDPRPLAVMLQARPEDEARTARLTIIRDTGLSRAVGRLALTQDLATRLSEVVAAAGFRPESLAGQGHEDGATGVFQADAVGVDAAGRRRMFTAVYVSRVGQPSFRCYWQVDAADPQRGGEFEAWRGSLKLGEERVGAALASGAPLFGGTSTPVVASGSVPAVPGAQPSPPAAAALSSGVLDLANRARDSLVVIEGEKGVGSGFLCRIGDAPMLFTNIHVVCDNPQPRFAGLSGGAIEVTEGALATGADIFRLRAPKASAALEAVSDLGATVKIGDPVAVLGNAEGAGVVKPLEGKVVGIGPNLVEVDAPFVPGNSGSPIIHVPTGKVIGIATYLQIRKVNNESGEVDTSVRRFGYRIDTVPAWEPMDGRRFATQAAQLTRIQATSAEFIKLFEDARAKKLSYANFSNPSIRRALETFERSVRGSRMSEADINNTRRQLFSDLRSAAVGDINAFDNRTAYDYFRRTVAEEKKMRDEVYSSFSKAIEGTRH